MRVHARGNLHDGGHFVRIVVDLADMVQRRNTFHLVAGKRVDGHDRLTELVFRIS